MKPSLPFRRFTRKSLPLGVLGGCSAALLAFAAVTPSAGALTFNSETSSTNPFFFSNWTLNENGTTINPVICEGENFPCVSYPIPGDDATISSGGPVNTITTWTSSNNISRPGIGAYAISFSSTFNPTDNTSADYLIDQTPYLLGSSNSIWLLADQTLTFRITNISGFGDLAITNFNATPVPSPLPIAGLGLAALGIYRARRRKINT